MTRYPPQVDETSVTRPQQPTTTPAVDLADWLAGLTDVERHGDLDTVVTGISLSTARIRPGDVYAALPGTRAHGADFAEQALAAGAVVVLTDPTGAGAPARRRTRPRRAGAPSRAGPARGPDLRQPGRAT